MTHSDQSRRLSGSWPADREGPQAWITRDYQIMIFRAGHAHGISPDAARRLATELVQCADEVEGSRS